MRFNSNLRAAAFGALIVSAALPVLAAGKHFAKAGEFPPDDRLREAIQCRGASTGLLRRKCSSQ